MKVIKLIAKIDDAFSYVGVGVFILLTVVVFVQVVLRYFFSTTLVWGEELCRFAFIWMAYIGFTSCMRHDSHLKVDVITEKLYGKPKTILYVVTMLISFGFFIFVAYWGYDMLTLVRDSEQVALTLPLPLIFVWGSIPVAFALAGLHALANIVKALNPEK